MRRVLRSSALAGVFLLGGSSAGAYERREIDPPHLSSPRGHPAQIAALEQTPADVAIDQPMVPPAMPKEVVASALPPPPAVTLLLKADLTTQRLTVHDGSQILHVWPISSGRRGYATPTGTFRPSWMAKVWYSRQYDDSPMPHSVFFNRGIAFHATAAVSLLGQPASHGCVRLAPAHAAELFALVRRHGLARTKVVVEGAAVFPPAAVARRTPAERKRNMAAASGSGFPLLSAAQWLFMQ